MIGLSQRRRERRRISTRGASTVEMVLVGIPLVFILISIFEISRGMWVYHTCAYAVKNGIRYAIVHGVNCVYDAASNPNDCTAHISDVAKVIQNSAIGLDQATTQLTFKSVSASSTCYLSSCVSDTTTQWPPSGDNSVGKLVRIDISTPFNSALAMFWPGAKAVSFTQISLGATSSDYVQF